MEHDFVTFLFEIQWIDEQNGNWYVMENYTISQIECFSRLIKIFIGKMCFHSIFIVHILVYVTLMSRTVL